MRTAPYDETITLPRALRFPVELYPPVGFIPDRIETWPHHGVLVVWILLPDTRELIVITADGEQRLGRGERAPAHPAVPDLAPAVAELFSQIDHVQS